MEKTLDAVFEDGVLKPLEALDLAEHQRVRITVATSHELDRDSAGDALKAWREVYDGLSAGDMADVERIAFDRSRFMRGYA